ncbi:hypothetical protein ACSS6W_010768 [Trichoderma asperelloides]
MRVGDPANLSGSLSRNLRTPCCLTIAFLVSLGSRPPKSRAARRCFLRSNFKTKRIIILGLGNDRIIRQMKCQIDRQLALRIYGG